LLLLAGIQEKLPAEDADPAFAEEMLCKALLALREAKEMKPTDARTRAFLAEAYERCGNHRAAEAERAGFRTALSPRGLSAAERRNFPIVCQFGP
jgi:Flp pilus assembly protein TadD